LRDVNLLSNFFLRLLFEKRKELGDSANRLRSGLSKIIDTRIKVEQMSVKLEENKAKAAQFQKECEDYLVILVSQKREADEQQKSVAAFQNKIQEEETKCLVIAKAAESDLAEATPALDEATKALESLSKKDIAEIKAYANPPALVAIVMEAVMIVKQSEPSWTEAKRQLGDVNFIKSLIEFDKNNIPDRVLKKINKYTSEPDFQPDKVGNVSGAAKSLCMWVRAMEVYGQIYRVVQPKRERYDQAMAQLKEKQEALSEAKRKLDDVNILLI
jgi:dynein heavy chain